MDYNERRYEGSGVDKRGELSNKKDKRNKRVRSENDDDSENDGESQEIVQK